MLTRIWANQRGSVGVKGNVMLSFRMTSTVRNTAGREEGRAAPGGGVAAGLQLNQIRKVPTTKTTMSGGGGGGVAFWRKERYRLVCARF